MRRFTDAAPTHVDADVLGSLAIVSHVVHYRRGGRLFAYAPYVREVEVWADLFPEVVIAAPCRDDTPPGDCTLIASPNVSIACLPETGGPRWRDRVRQLLLVPVMLGRLAVVMSSAAAVHVRCPGNLGLLGALLAPLLSRRLVAKYAGQWTAYPGEPLTYRLQKAILRSRWWRGPVTVYGEWPDQPQHVVPFFTSVLDEAQMERARAAARGRRYGAKPIRVLFVGRLSHAKNVDVLLRAAARVRQVGRELSIEVVGEGPERRRLERLAEELGIAMVTRFVGGVSFDDVLDHYESADVLVLASRTEGWPKAIAEAMAFGLVCVGSDRGLLPQMLGEGRGLTVPPGDVESLARALAQVATVPAGSFAMGRRAAAWAQRFTLEGFEYELRRLLSVTWNAPALSSDPTEVPVRNGIA